MIGLTIARGGPAIERGFMGVLTVEILRIGKGFCNLQFSLCRLRRFAGGVSVLSNVNLLTHKFIITEL